MSDGASPFRTRPARRFLAAFKSVSMDGDGLLKEVRDIHDGRSAMMGKLARKASPERLRSASVREQAARSRLVGIQLEIGSVLDDVDRMRDAAVARIMGEHQDLLKIRTATDQRAYLKHGLEAGLPWLASLCRARDAAKYVMDDIDKAAWSLRLTATTFELATRPELA